jgi:hypothetical protein
MTAIPSFSGYGKFILNQKPIYYFNDGLNQEFGTYLGTSLEK